MYQKDEFLSRIREQIASEEKYSAILDEAPRKFARSRKFLLIPLAFYLLAVFLSVLRDHTLENVLVLWICSVFILYMVNFFIMMIPSFGSDADIKIIDKPIPELIRDFLRLANIVKTVNKNKITIVEFFWNAFIINTKALARGFSLLFISNVFCAAVLFAMGTMHWTTFLILAGQTAVIVLMYWKIVKAVPGTPGFFTKYGIPEERMGIPAEGEGQVIVVQGNILCQRHCQVKPQCKVTVALGKAVNLLFCFSAALGKEDLGIFNNRCIQRCKAVTGIGIAQNGHHTLQLDLLFRQQFHKTGEGTRFDSFHAVIPFVEKPPNRSLGGWYCQLVY